MSRRDDRSGMEDGVRLTLLEVDVDKIEKETRAGFDRVGKSVDDLREDVTSELKEIRSKQDASETRSRQLQIAILVALISVLVALAANLAFPVR